MPTTVTSTSTLIVVQARTTSENREAARTLIANFAAPTREEPGCLQYELLEDLDDPDHIVILEEWADDSSLAAHNNTTSYATLMSNLLPLLDGGGSGMRLRRLS